METILIILKKRNKKKLCQQELPRKKIKKRKSIYYEKTYTLKIISHDWYYLNLFNAYELQEYSIISSL
jgi:hypothetical protein